MEMHKNILSNVFGTLLAMVAVTPAANATILTTGVIEMVTPQTGRFNFDFTIGGLSLVGHTDGGSRFLRAGYEGDIFNGNLDSRYGPIDMFWGYMEDEFVLWQGGTGPVRTRFNALASGTVLTQGQTVYHSAFDFEGSLCALMGGPIYETPCDVVFPSLTGQGIAEFLFDESILDDGRHYFAPLKATYTFHPVPEPGTLALICVGFAGIAFTRRRQLLNGVRPS